MKKTLAALFTIITLSVNVFAQTQYEIQNDYVTGGHLLKGFISRDILVADTSFKWYSQNLKPYTGKDAAEFGKHKDSIQLVIFVGTWCEDSHVVIPKLFPFFDAAGFSNDRITLIGVDRNKKSISHITDAFNVINGRLLL
jgi:hypothetical protein